MSGGPEGLAWAGAAVPGASPIGAASTAAARIATALLAAVLLAAAAAPAPARADHRLPPPVRAALERADVPPEAFAAVALPLSHVDAAFGFQGGRAFQPASAIKVLTTVVALHRIGPDARGFTELRSTAPVEGGVLRGDLALVGGADVEFGLPALWRLLQTLRARGIAAIDGDLLIDRSLFEPARTDRGLPPFDERPEFPYNVIPDALHFAGSLLPLGLRAEGGAVQATLVPPLDGLALVNRMTLAADDASRTASACRAWSRGWQPAIVTREGAAAAGSAAGPAASPPRITIELGGSFPAGAGGEAAGEAGGERTGERTGTPAGGCSVEAALQLIDRDELVERAFRTLWREAGGRFTGRVREGVAPAGARVLARREARPWGEVIRHVNKESDNPQTRLLFALLGTPPVAPREPGTTTQQRADRTVRAWLAEQGIEAPGLVLDNGSGLSRSERIAPLTLARVLQVAWRSRWASELTMSLPRVGVETALSLKDTPAAAFSRLKPGGLRDVASLAGYVVDVRGRSWAVVTLVNHDRAARAIPALHAFVDHVARHGSGVGAAPATGPQGEGP